MQTFDITTKDEIIPSKENPDYLVETDFEICGIVTLEHSNSAMKAAIDAVSILTNCGVLSIKEN